MHFFLTFFLHDVFLFVFLCHMHRKTGILRQKPPEKVNQTQREIRKRHPTGETLPTEDIARYRRQYVLTRGSTPEA